MIQTLEIKNFKSIKHKIFPLRNLNVLLGLNGMGKSSVIQSLLLLKQSLESIKTSKRIDLNGDYVKIGSTKDALYQYTKKEECLEFNLLFDMDVFDFFNKNQKLNIRLDYLAESDYFLIKKSLAEPEKDELYFMSLLEQSLFSNNMQYLNANRKEPTSIHGKHFTNVVNRKNLGNSGEFTAHYIEVHSNEEVVFENLIHKKSITIDEVTGETIINKTLINQINLWMGEISPNVNIRTTSISSDFVMLEYVFKQPNFGNTNRYKPENVGFGISYVLPVVTALLAAKPKELIIIENPESHIHPRGQAELGKLIALTAMNDVQIIVETHSDHLLNGVRVAVKENLISEDKAIVFYFDKTVEASEQYSKITDIKIDKNGELSAYPKNMLDEWGNQLFKLM